MSKILLNTTGEFMLYDVANGDMVEHFRPYLVTPSNFFHQRLSLGQLKVVADGFPSEANDADWAKVLAASEGDVELAVAAYKAELAGEKPDDKPAALLGSSVLPAMVKLAEGVEVQLGDVVRQAHKNSKLSVEAWNDLPEVEREERLAKAVEKMSKKAAKK